MELVTFRAQSSIISDKIGVRNKHCFVVTLNGLVQDERDGLIIGGMVRVDIAIVDFRESGTG